MGHCSVIQSWNSEPMNAEQLHLGAGRTTLVQMIALLDQQFLAAIGSPASNRAWWIFLAGFLATVAVSLLVLSWTRWGQSKVLTKCAAIAVLAHIWLLLYA